MEIASVLIVLLTLLGISSVIARRRRIEALSQSRNEWRELTRQSAQDVDQWRTFYSEIQGVLVAQNSVIESLKARGVDVPEHLHFERRKQAAPIKAHASDHALHRNTDPKNPNLPTQRRLALARTHIEPACQHPEAIDVEISTGEVVAQICTKCQQQITSPAWMEQDLVDEEKRVIHGRTVADLKPPPKGPAPGGAHPKHKSKKVACGYCGSFEHEHTDPHRQCTNGHMLKPGESWCKQCDNAEIREAATDYLRNRDAF
jgi:hypothetical protein